MQEYKQINCEVHDGYELACMRRDIHQVTWMEGEHTRTETLRFLDLETSKHQEFLIAESQTNEQFRIRLDLIRSRLPY